LKADIFIEIFLWNKNVDSLVRVLQRMEALGIWSRQGMTAYEGRLEELRASVNADFAELISVKERFEQHRFESQRLATELANSFADHATTQIKHRKQTKH
jgi:hypothetical protein